MKENVKIEISKFICDSVAKDKIAFFYENKIINYANLIELIEANINVLKSHGLNKGDVVALNTNDLVGLIAGFIAVIELGGIAYPMFNFDNMSSSMKTVNVRFSVSYSEKSRTLLVSNNFDYDCTKSVPDWINTQSAGLPAVIISTSGTSGTKPKYVVQSLENLNSTVYYICNEMKLSGDLVEYIGSPPDNVFWLGRVRCALNVGGTLILDSMPTNPVRALALIDRHQANCISGDTSFILVLLEYFQVRLKNLSSQVLMIKLSSQAIPLDKLSALQETFFLARITMGYGLTEAMRSTLITYNDFRPTKFSSVGRPFKNLVKISIMDELGNECSKGTIGEIFVSGKNVALGYWNSEELSRQKFKDGGFYTGDYGYLDDEGFLYFSSRKDLAMNVGGKIIHPSYFEKDFAKAFPPLTFCVLGINKSSLLGDEPVLILETSQLKKIDNHLGFLREVLKNNSHKSLITKIIGVDKIPITSNGKIKFSELRELISDQIKS